MSMRAQSAQAGTTRRTQLTALLTHRQACTAGSRAAVIWFLLVTLHVPAYLNPRSAPVACVQGHFGLSPNSVQRRRAGCGVQHTRDLTRQNLDTMSHGGATHSTSGSNYSTASCGGAATAQLGADPLANSGHFFGMTTLGATDPFFDNAATTVCYPFHLIPEERYLEVFRTHLLTGHEYEAILRIDGSKHILRAKLGDILNTLLGRQAHKTELQAWFTFCDFDRSALMCEDEYVLAVELLRSFSEAPQKARQYSSYDAWRADALRNRRVSWQPQRSFQEPLTTSQAIGWHATKPYLPQPDDHKALPSTDVTRKEGRTAASYFGYMTML